VDGSLRTLLTDDARGLLAYERSLGAARAVVAFNASDEAASVTLSVENGSYRQAFPDGGTREVIDRSLAVELAPRGAVVWIRAARQGG
jgi:hypothetical protein